MPSVSLPWGPRSSRVFWRVAVRTPVGPRRSLRLRRMSRLWRPIRAPRLSPRSAPWRSRRAPMASTRAPRPATTLLRFATTRTMRSITALAVLTPQHMSCKDGSPSSTPAPTATSLAPGHTTTRARSTSPTPRVS